jgi:hypothetical protein
MGVSMPGWSLRLTPKGTVSAQNPSPWPHRRKILAVGAFTGHFGTIPGKKPVEHCFFCFFIVFWEKTMFETANTMFGGFFYCFFPSNIV